MASYITPNMNLIVPVPTREPSPDWAYDLNASLTILDQHTHASGSGVLITPSALNINADLPLTSHNLTLVRTIRFSAQVSPITGSTPDLGCLYESGVDLYYNDGGGNQIRITQSGSVAGSAGTITGLPSGTASAAYGASVFVFQAATATAANIDVGSVLLRNNTASSFALTLAPPSAMGADLSLVLPALPGATNFLTLDVSGNIAANVAISHGITRAMQVVVGQAVSASSGVFSTSSTSFVDVTNVTVTLTTTGRPVCIYFVSDGSGNSSYISAVRAPDGVAAGTIFKILQDTTEIARTTLEIDVLTPSNSDPRSLIPPGALNHIYAVSAGTYVYKLQVAAGAATTTSEVLYVKMFAYEL